MREFEELRQQIHAIGLSDLEHQDAKRAAGIEFEMICKRHNGFLESNVQQRRELQAKFYNIQERLASVIGHANRIEATYGMASANDCLRA